MGRHQGDLWESLGDRGHAQQVVAHLTRIVVGEAPHEQRSFLSLDDALLLPGEVPDAIATSNAPARPITVVAIQSSRRGADVPVVMRRYSHATLVETTSPPLDGRPRAATMRGARAPRSCHVGRPDQLIELIALAGQYPTIAYITSALAIEREATAPRFPESAMSGNI